MSVSAAVQGKSQASWAFRDLGGDGSALKVRGSVVEELIVEELVVDFVFEFVLDVSGASGRLRLAAAAAGLPHCSHHHAVVPAARR